MDLICQSTRQRLHGQFTPTENAKPTNSYYRLCSFGTCLWLVHHSSIYTISQNKCLHRQTFVSLHFTFFVLHRHPGFLFCFIQTEVCGNPASSKSYIDTFPPAFVHLVFLCHILVHSPYISNVSIIILLVICEQ